MAELQTGADGVRVYLTGATESGGIQRDHALALGNYRSRERVSSMTVRRYHPLSNVVIEHAAGYNGAGLGILRATGTSALAWTPPGGSEGASVTIANGERKILTGSTASKFILVRRTDASDLGGTETVQLIDTVNNVVGMTNFAIPETPAGDEQYRALMFVNESGSTITDLKIRIDTDSEDTKARAAAETPSSGQLTTIADVWTAPGGISFSSIATWTTLSASLAADGAIGCWLQRYVLSTTDATALSQLILQYQFTLSGTTYYGHLRGINRVSRGDLKQYLYFVGTNAEPDISGAATAEFDAADLPYTAAALAADNTYYLRVVQQNSYGLKEQIGQLVKLEIAADSSLVSERPSGPSEVKIAPAADGNVRVQADYNPRIEGTTQSDQLTYKADRWAVYISVGTDPDPDTDTPYTETMSGGLGPQRLDYTTTDDYLEDTPLHVLVRTQRNDGTTESPDWVESENDTVTIVYADWFGPIRPLGAVSIGTSVGVYQGPVTVSSTEYIDEAKNIYWQFLVGETRLWANTDLVWNLVYRGGPERPENGLFTTLVFQEGDVSTAQTATVEVGTWDGAAKELHFAVNGTRRMTVDMVAGTVQAAALSDVLAVSQTLSDDGAWGKYAYTCFQVFDEEYEQYRSGASLDTSGVLRLDVPWIQKATQAACL